MSKEMNVVDFNEDAEVTVMDQEFDHEEIKVEEPKKRTSKLKDLKTWQKVAIAATGVMILIVGGKKIVKAFGKGPKLDPELIAHEKEIHDAFLNAVGATTDEVTDELKLV